MPSQLLHAMFTRLAPYCNAVHLSSYTGNFAEYGKNTRRLLNPFSYCLRKSMSEYDFSEAYTGILCEFLEVAFHQILFTRSVYPGGFFERRRKYGISVQMCRHPLLSDYIQNVLRGMVPLLNKNLVKKVELILLGDDAKPVEKFVFAVSRPDNMSAVQNEDPQLRDLEANLKGVLLRIGTSESLLGRPLCPPPPDAVSTDSLDSHAFEIHIHAVRSAAKELESTAHFQEFPWILADPPEGDPPQAGALPQIVPLKSLKTNLLNCMCMDRCPLTVCSDCSRALSEKADSLLTGTAYRRDELVLQLFVQQVPREDKGRGGGRGDSDSMEQ